MCVLTVCVIFTAHQVVTFIDLAGHEKYLKTTIFGMTGHAPDFCMLMIGSNAGVIGMTKGILNYSNKTVRKHLKFHVHSYRTSWFGLGT